MNSVLVKVQVLDTFKPYGFCVVSSSEEHNLVIVFTILRDSVGYLISSKKYSTLSKNTAQYGVSNAFHCSVFSLGIDNGE